VTRRRGEEETDGPAPPPGPLRAAVRGADAVAGLALLALLGVVAGAILARLLHDLSGGAVDLLIPGAVELSRLALLVLVFAALPGALMRGLVRVDLLAGRLPARPARALERLWAALALGLGGLLAWRLGAEALAQRASGEATQDLALPLWAFGAVAAAAALLFALVALFQLARAG
jgi:TRAP-type C4-dicarboxylate transport system permease small subunit